MVKTLQELDKIVEEIGAFFIKNKLDTQDVNYILSWLQYFSISSIVKEEVKIQLKELLQNQGLIEAS